MISEVKKKVLFEAELLLLRSKENGTSKSIKCLCDTMPNPTSPPLWSVTYYLNVS